MANTRLLLAQGFALTKRGSQRADAMQRRLLPRRGDYSG
eukprot:gene39169-59466_t